MCKVPINTKAFIIWTTWNKTEKSTSINFNKCIFVLTIYFNGQSLSLLCSGYYQYLGQLKSQSTVKMYS